MKAIIHSALRILHPPQYCYGGRAHSALGLAWCLGVSLLAPAARGDNTFANARPLTTEPGHLSRIAWPLGRCRPPTLLAMGQNHQKAGNNCLMTPSARSDRIGLQRMRAKTNSPLPAQRQ